MLIFSWIYLAMSFFLLKCYCQALGALKCFILTSVCSCTLPHLIFTARKQNIICSILQMRMLKSRKDKSATWPHLWSDCSEKYTKLSFLVQALSTVRICFLSLITWWMHLRPQRHLSPFMDDRENCHTSRLCAPYHDLTYDWKPRQLVKGYYWGCGVSSELETLV
jgi:hypothetical protein